MSKLRVMKRISRQYRVCGIKGCLLKAKIHLQRNLLYKTTFLYVADLVSLKNQDPFLPEKYSISYYHSQSEISDMDLERYFRHIGKEITELEMNDRFSKNAILWLLRVENEPAGFVWSITGKMVSPYFIPLAPNDSVLFDAITFPEFRGKGIYPLLLNHVILRLRNNGCTRAFGHAEEWNQSSIRGLAKTHLSQFGKARKMSAFGRTFVVWQRM